MSQQDHYLVDDGDNVVISAVDAMRYKSHSDTITGLVATTGVDKVNDAFTKDALRDIAKQLREDIETVEAFFMDADEEALKKLKEEQFEGTTGNVDHNNDPAVQELGIGDPRIVPAFKLTHAEYVENPIDGVEAGVRVKGKLNTEGNPDDVAEAIKASIANGFIDSMSIEYIPEKTQKVRTEDGETIRKLQKVEVRGSAITARPANPMATLTDHDLKSLVDDDMDNKQELPDEGVTREAGVAFVDTADGELDASAISNDIFEHHYLFPGDTKSESSYPVVDAEHNLRAGNVEAAHQLGARGGVSEEELRNKLKALNQQWPEGERPIEFGDEEGGKNAMGDDPETDEVTQDDLKELKGDFEELQSKVDELEEEKESLQEENQELKSKLEDMSTIEELKGDLDELRDELGDVKSDVQPLRQKGSAKFDSELEEYVAKTVKHASREHVEKHKSQIAQDHGVSEDQVDDALESATEGDN